MHREQPEKVAITWCYKNSRVPQKAFEIFGNNNFRNYNVLTRARPVSFAKLHAQLILSYIHVLAGA